MRFAQHASVAISIMLAACGSYSSRESAAALAPPQITAADAVTYINPRTSSPRYQAFLAGAMSIPPRQVMAAMQRYVGSGDLAIDGVAVVGLSAALKSSGPDDSFATIAEAIAAVGIDPRRPLPAAALTALIRTSAAAFHARPVVALALDEDMSMPCLAATGADALARPAGKSWILPGTGAIIGLSCFASAEAGAEAGGAAGAIAGLEVPLLGSVVGAAAGGIGGGLTGLAACLSGAATVAASPLATSALKDKACPPPTVAVPSEAG